ncbi:MAG: helix-turn-helix domain-containing protein [Deltaproteobacteria bacterium]|nr:helix-turn-helix domain-containing protein [Deltaproteobacteria bacterium]
MKRFKFKYHHTEKELIEIWKREKNLKVRARIHALRLMMYSNHSKKIICEMTGKGRTTIFDWCRRYNEKGIDGLRDSQNIGGSVALSDIIKTVF